MSPQKQIKATFTSTLPSLAERLSAARSLLTTMEVSTNQKIAHSRKKAAAHIKRARARMKTHAEKRIAAQLLQYQDQLQRELAKIVKQFHVDTIAAALAIAERILDQKINSDPKALSQIIARTVRRYKSTASAVVSLNPTQRVLIESTLRDLLPGKLEIVSTPEILSGCARVSIEGGNLIIDWRGALKAFAQKLQSDSDQDGAP